MNNFLSYLYNFFLRIKTLNKLITIDVADDYISFLENTNFQNFDSTLYYYGEFYIK